MILGDYRGFTPCMHSLKNNLGLLNIKRKLPPEGEMWEIFIFQLKQIH